jgi:hypothetical protein
VYDDFKKEFGNRKFWDNTKHNTSYYICVIDPCPKNILLCYNFYTRLINIGNISYRGAFFGRGPGEGNGHMNIYAVLTTTKIYKIKKSIHNAKDECKYYFIENDIDGPFELCDHL